MGMINIKQVIIGSICCLVLTGCNKCVKKIETSTHPVARKHLAGINRLVTIGKYRIKVPNGWTYHNFISKTFDDITFSRKTKNSETDIHITRTVFPPGLTSKYKPTKPSDFLKGMNTFTQMGARHFSEITRKVDNTNFHLIFAKPEWIHKYPGYLARYEIVDSSSRKFKFKEVSDLVFATSRAEYDIYLTIAGPIVKQDPILKSVGLKTWNGIIKEFDQQSKGK